MAKITLHLNSGETLVSEFERWHSVDFEEEALKVQAAFLAGTGRIPFEERPKGIEHILSVESISRIELNKDA